MTELYTAPQSYVREFNAASMAEAIKLADAALRMDGVTVAVWKNYAEIMPAEFHTMIDRMIDDINGENKRTGRPRIGRDFNDEQPHNMQELMSYWPDEISADFMIDGRLRKYFSTINTDIHQDIALSESFSNNALSPFHGNPIRALYNIEGRPTEFMRDKQMTDIYSLPKGSLAFFKYKVEKTLDCSEAAWHRGVDEDIPRAFMSISLSPR